MQLQQGQKLQLQQLSITNELIIEIDLKAPFSIDLSCFGLDTHQKLSDDRYMIFYNQPTSPDAAIHLQAPKNNQFIFKLNQVNTSQIQKMVICAAIDDAEATMRQIQGGQIKIKNPQDQVLATFDINPQLFSQEKAIMLCEVYFKDVWSLGMIAQGFNGGLAALVEHFGGEVATPESVVVEKSTTAARPATATSPPSKPVSLQKISLNKAGQSHRINLNKNNPEYLKIDAVWVDNGDSSSDNDDLDLRVGLLIKDQKKMEYIWCPKFQGSLTAYPYVEHQGDIQAASAQIPGQETVLVNSEIAKHLKGTVALVFSVYSAVSNGMVSIASLQPKMRMEYGDQLVECVFNSSVSPQAQRSDVYTYVIGIAMIDENGITLQHSGLTSKSGSEDTPRILWQKDGTVEIKVDGPSMFK